MSQARQSSQIADESFVRDLAYPLGFSLLGVAAAEPSPYGQYVRRWLASGQHGQMGYLAENIDKRLDPRRFLPGAQSVISVADRYVAVGDPSGPARVEGRNQATTCGHAAHPGLAETRPSKLKRGRPVSPRRSIGRIARYAWGNDYHTIIKKRLHTLADALRRHWPNHQYLTCVDTAAILEREHASRAGLGWIGKHTLLIHPRLGSWLLLGQIVTTLPVECSEPTRSVTTDHCGNCTRCIDACPTRCIAPKGYQIDAQRCIGYLTVEHRGTIDPQLHGPMGQWIAGCDVCQQVCPFNVEGTARLDESSPQGGEGLRPEYEPRSPAPQVDLFEVLGWDAEDRRRAFQGSALRRIKLDPLKRNAIIAAGNYLRKHLDDRLRRRLDQMACDPRESDLVRTTAAQVLEQLASHRSRP